MNTERIWRQILTTDNRCRLSGLYTSAIFTRMSTDTTNLLITKSLTRKFGSLVAVNDLNIAVTKNIIFGLIGLNGAGKSTLIKMLTTLLDPTSGDAFINNVSIVDKPNKIRELIGYVPQLISADGSLTGYENLKLFACLYHIPKKEQRARIQEALELMDLTQVAKRLVNTYSGGMIRRLEVVLAMLHRPEVLFLDEPTTGLDVIARNHLWDYLKAAHAKYNMTIFLTTHDMEEAEKLCDQVAIMDQGKIVVTGSPHELKRSLPTPNANLGDVFVHYTGGHLEQGGNYKAIARQRTVSKKLGG